MLLASQMVQQVPDDWKPFKLKVDLTEIIEGEVARFILNFRHQFKLVLLGLIEQPLAGPTFTQHFLFEVRQKLLF